MTRHEWTRTDVIVCVGMLVVFGIWFLGDVVVRRTATAHQAAGEVVWIGDASYENHRSGVGMQASSSQRVMQDGMRMQIDGRPKLLEHTGARGSFGRFSKGDRVRVDFREGGFLFWSHVHVSRIEKLAAE